MPVQKGKSPLMAKYGQALVEAAKKHAADPVDYGFQRIPGGIKNGIAKLTSCGFGTVAEGKQNAGEYYFTARGVVVEPEFIIDPQTGAKIPVAGLQTSIIEMVCSTTNQAGKTTTLEEHVAKIQNEMKKLGAENPADLEATAAALEKAGPYFKFSTSYGKPSPQYPEPRVFENWNGTEGLEDYAPPEGGSVQDDSAPAGETAADAGGGEFTGDIDGSGTTASDDGDDLDALVEAAGSEDEDTAKPAMERLTELALAAGIEQDAIDNAEGWTELKDMIVAAGSPGEEAAEEEAPAEPKKGDVMMYQALDPKTKKPAVDPKTKKPRKKIEVEIQKVDKAKGTADVKNLDDGKTVYKAVPLAQLSVD